MMAQLHMSRNPEPSEMSPETKPLKVIGIRLGHNNRFSFHRIVVLRRGREKVHPLRTQKVPITDQSELIPKVFGNCCDCLNPRVWHYSWETGM